MKTINRVRAFTNYSIVVTVLLFALFSCTRKVKVTEAQCVLAPIQGSTVNGTVTFTETKNGIKVVADLTGLTPGLHGFHIHEFGDCSGPDGSSAGGHFNPNDQPHGALMDTHRHAGDMGNILADSLGNSHMEFRSKTMTLNGKKSIVDKGLIVHKNEDDLKTQPTGNAGPREACGTIIKTN